MTSPRVGIVVVGHGTLSTALVEAACTIVPDHGPIQAVAIDSTVSRTIGREAVAAAIAATDQGAGVLILTDIFGGTPSNICLEFLAEDQVAVVSGVNLPTVIKLLGETAAQPLATLVPFIRDYAQGTIVIAERVLQGDVGHYAG